MTREAFIKEIRERLEEKGVQLTSSQVKDVIYEEERLVYEIIALNDKIKYIYGTIYGVEMPPKYITGKAGEYDGVRRNHGYSQWKQGYPKIKWSTLSKSCEVKKPEEFFEQDSERYTTAARQFRQVAGFPEIPEYQDLSEDKIQELCQRADQAKIEHFSTQKKRYLARTKEKSKKLTEAGRLYRETNGIIPVGGTLPDYTGPKWDTIDWYLHNKIKPEHNVAERLEMVLRAEDIADGKHYDFKYDLLHQLEMKLRRDVARKGVDLVPHKNVAWIKRKPLNHFGPDGEYDPWGTKKATYDSIRELKEFMKQRALERAYTAGDEFLEENLDESLITEDYNFIFDYNN